MSLVAGARLDAGELYPTHAPYVRRTLTSLGVASGDVDDMAHEVFVTLVRRGSVFPSASAARSYLFGVARRVASNYRRARRRFVRGTSQLPLPEQPVGPDEAVARAEAGGMLHRFTRSLSPVAQEVFVLAEVEGLSGPDVAARLGLPLNTTYSHIRRVRARLSRFVVGAVVALVVLVSMLAGTCAAQGADDRPRIAIGHAAQLRG